MPARNRAKKSAAPISREIRTSTDPARTTPGADAGVDRPDTNIVIAGLLGDLAAAQTDPHRKFGYKQAASAIRRLEEPIEALVEPDGTLARIPRIGPASARVIMDVVRTGGSPFVEAAVDASGRRADILRRRGCRDHFLSHARVREILAGRTPGGPGRQDYHGDLQMHSTWSDGAQSLEAIFAAGIDRNYRFAAVTDHSAGLPIANGVPFSRFLEQRREIARLNARHRGRFRLLSGVEANIRADGEVDVPLEERRLFDVVVAAPHSALRRADMQTERMIAAVTAPGVHILGHPRGRMYGSRPGVAADWPRVFAAAARSGVAIELDGDPSRQDLDWVLARQALDAGCIFALDSDAHDVDEWSNVDCALAHAVLAGIPAERIINAWELDRLLAWAARRREGRAPA
ncbi:MAG TPA: DNA polymerase/3'-5' exonuclease PolX [Vicinamibacterales bacterium]|nr:DNA polymerase/3'-5' exonuclease PolX [Vicinamibacterales bacterium]